MECPECRGLGYWESGRGGIFRVWCVECEGTGIAPKLPIPTTKEIFKRDTISGTGSDDSPTGSGDPSQSSQPQKPKARKRTGKRPVKVLRQAGKSLPVQQAIESV